MQNNKKVIKSSAFLGAGQAIEIITAVVLMPFLIATLGTKNYGLWVLLNSIVGFLVVLNMGLSSAVEKELSLIPGGTLSHRYKEIFSTGLAILCSLSLLALLLIFIAVGLSDLIIDDMTLKSVTISILWIFGLKTVLLLPTIAFQAVISSELRHDLTVISEQIMVIVKLILIIFIVGETKSLVDLALIVAFTELLSRFALIFIAIRLKGGELLRLTTPSFYFGKKLINYSLPTFGIWLVERSRGAMPNFTLTYFINLEAIAIYNIGNMIATYVGQMIAVSTGPLMPYFNKIMYGNSFEKKNNVMNLLNISFCVVIVPLSLYILGFIFSGDAFIRLLFDIDDISAYYSGIILAFYITFYSSQQPFYRMFYSKGTHVQLFKLTLIEVPCIFLLSIYLVPNLGIAGQALSVLLPVIVTRHILIYPLFNYSDEFSPKSLKKTTRIWVLPLLILIVVSIYANQYIRIVNWFDFVYYNLLFVLIFISIYYFFIKFSVQTRWKKIIEEHLLENKSVSKKTKV